MSTVDDGLGDVATGMNEAAQDGASRLVTPTDSQ
jgi:hypothetical protein